MPKLLNHTKAGSLPYFMSIPDDEPVFILRAQDIFAPATIMSWAKGITSVNGHDPLLVEKANEVIKLMESWRPRKLPD